MTPSYDASVGSEPSNHCAIPAPQKEINNKRNHFEVKATTRKSFCFRPLAAAPCLLTHEVVSLIASISLWTLPLCLLHPYTSTLIQMFLYVLG